MPNAILDADLIVGFASDPSRPFIESTDLARQVRWDGVKFIDCTNHNDWLIDSVGNKRLPSMHPNSEWQRLECPLNSDLVRDGEIWRVKGSVEKVDDEKARAKDRVRDAAESYRARFITTRAGKQNAYMMKATVAARIVVAGDAATDEDKAIFAREAEARSMTVGQLAQLIAIKAAQFEQINGLIEAIEAETITAIEAVDANADDAFEQINQALEAGKTKAESEFAALEA